MMRIDILTVLPEMIEGMVNCSIVKRAQDKGLAEIHLHNLRDYTTNKWRRVDDYPFGGEAGMVMQIDPLLFEKRSRQNEKSERIRRYSLFKQDGKISFPRDDIQYYQGNSTPCRLE